MSTQINLTNGTISGSPRVISFDVANSVTSGLTASTVPGDNRYAVTAYTGEGETGDVVTLINDGTATIVKPLAE